MDECVVRYWVRVAGPTLSKGDGDREGRSVLRIDGIPGTTGFESLAATRLSVRYLIAVARAVQVD